MFDPQPLTIRKCNMCGGSGGTMRGTSDDGTIDV